MSAIDVYINGVLTADCLQANTWGINLTANRRSTARGSLFSGTDLASLLRVEDGDEIRIDIDGVPQFGGEIEKPTERSAGGTIGVPFYTDFVARDFYGRVKRRYINETIPAGTLKQALQVIVTYLPGITLDPAQVDGPMLPELPLNDVLAEKAIALVLDYVPGWIAEIDESEVFRVFEPGTVAAPFNIGVGGVMPVSDIQVERPREGYANYVIVRNATHRVIAKDDPAIADKGRWEVRIDADDAYDEVTLQALADTALAASLAQPRPIRFTVDVAGLRQGQVTVVNYPFRQLNNTFLITEVDIQEVGGGQVQFNVKALEGLLFKEGYRATYDRWNGGGETIAAGAVAGASTSKRAYLLSAGVDAVSSADATGVPAAGGGARGKAAIQAQLDTVARGSRAATVTARGLVFTPGVTFVARLWDVELAAYVPGESAPISGTDWETVVFGVTLTEGNKFYEIHGIPDTADELFRLSGYVE